MSSPWFDPPRAVEQIHGALNDGAAPAAGHIVFRGAWKAAEDFATRVSELEAALAQTEAARRSTADALSKARA